MYLDWFDEVSLDGDNEEKTYNKPKSKLQRIIEIIFE